MTLLILMTDFKISELSQKVTIFQTELKFHLIKNPSFYFHSHEFSRNN